MKIERIKINEINVIENSRSSTAPQLTQLMNSIQQHGVENIQREPVTPAEIGRICEQLEKSGMTEGEMAARLTLSKETIKSLLKVYKQIPEDYREKIAFRNPGDTKNKKGTISVSVATRVLAVKGQFGLKRSSVNKLLDYAKTSQLSNKDIRVMAFLMQGGATLDDAIKRRKEYKNYRVDVIAIKSEIEDMCRREKEAPLVYLAKVC